jgi:hypothetical protein
MTPLAAARPGAVLNPLLSDSKEPCDGEAFGGVVALYEVVLPSGKVLMLCGHHARAVGYDPDTHENYLTHENKTQGSEN